MIVAAAASFALVTAIRTRGDGGSVPKAAESPSAGATAPPPSEESSRGGHPLASAPPPQAVASAGLSRGGTSLSVESLELPEGLTVSPDRGLLEIDIGGAQSIYIDGVFIGRGPVRRVPLREGQHEVRIQAESTEISQPVGIQRGRRTRVGMTKAP